MSGKLKSKINYLTRDVPKSHETGLEHLKWVSVVVDVKSTKRYHNNLKLLSNLSKCARLLLDFLTEDMDGRNMVENNASLKKRFNNAVSGNYNASSINKAFSELSGTELVKKIKKRGMYAINPLFFFNGTEIEREKLIRQELEKPFMKSVVKVRKKHYGSY